MSEPKNDPEKPYSREGYALMGAVFEVHRETGGGLLEEIYQQSIEVELDLRGIPFRPIDKLAVFYKGRKLRTEYIPDLTVHQHIVVELKAVSSILPEHEAQLINYMRISQQPVGYLVNFGPIAKVEWKRFVLSEFLNR